MTRRVIIHRNLLFVPNEAYIVAQAESLRRYTPILTGLRIDPRSVVSPRLDRAVLAELAGAPKALIEAIALRVLRIAPASLMRKLREAAPSLMHVHFGGDAYWALPIVRRLGLPLVVTFHGYDVNLRPASSLSAFAFSRLRPAVWKAASRIIAVSEFVKNRLIALGCPREKIVRHYIGVDARFFSRSRPPDPRPTIAFVGRLQAFKGCDLLIQAVSRLPKNAGTRLIVVGEGPEEERLRALAASLRVDAEFLSSQPPVGVRSALERAWLFCLPSFRSARGDEESLPIVTVEAQSMGLPVVASRIGGISEAVADGESGTLVSPRNVEELRIALERLLDDEPARLQMAAAARQRVMERFDIVKQTALLEDIYDLVMDPLQ